MTNLWLWLLCGFVGLLALFWAVDYARRRQRAARVYAMSRARVTHVKVADVIERETEGMPWREELLAAQPARVRVPEHWRYELVWGMIPQGASAVNFDVILSTKVLEHLLRVEPGLAELWRVCRPGGRVLLSTSSRHSIFISFANPLTWLEALASLYVPHVLPPFHNLERPNDLHSVVHRAFTRQELRAGFRAFQSISIRSCQYRLPGPLYRWIRSPQTLLRLEKFIARIPLVKHLGETLIVCAVK